MTLIDISKVPQDIRKIKQASNNINLFNKSTYNYSMIIQILISFIPEENLSKKEEVLIIKLMNPVLKSVKQRKVILLRRQLY